MARKHKKTAAANAWRPNFRNAEKLPDIKVVRTDFLLNLVTVSIAVILAGLVGFREYRIMSLSRANERLQENIAAGAEEDRVNVQRSSEFQRISQSSGEVAKFLNMPVEPDVLLYQIAGAQPEEVILDSINFTPTVERQGRREIVKFNLVLNGTVTDAPERSATEIITTYRNAFGNLEALKDYFQSSELSGFSRNEVLGNFTFTIRVVLTLEPKAE